MLSLFFNFIIVYKNGEFFIQNFLFMTEWGVV